MEFYLYKDVKSPVKTSISVRIGTYAITVEKVRWDSTFEHEETMIGISVHKMKEAAGVSDLDSLQTYMKKHFGNENGFDDLANFLEKNNIRREFQGYTRYE